MKNNKQFTSKISNEEVRKGVQKTFAQEVIPFLSENRKAYELHIQGKSSLELTPTQKASIKCQYPV